MKIGLFLLAVVCVGCGPDQRRIEYVRQIGELERENLHLGFRVRDLVDDSARRAPDHAVMVVTTCGDTLWTTGCANGGADSVHCVHRPKPDTCRWVYDWRVIPESTRVYKDQELLFRGPTIWVRDSIWHCPTKEGR